MLWLIQLGLPLGLIVLLAFRPARARAARLVQALAVAGTVLAVHLAGLWIVPPWWTPWLLWILLVLALWRSRIGASRRSSRQVDRALALVSLPFLAAGLWVTGEALRARTPPSVALVDLASPLPPGHYYVASGGSQELLNAHLRTLPRATPGQRNYWGQSYGIDVIAVDRWGTPARASTTVLAPCDGVVARARDGIADGAPVDLDSPVDRAGNHALIRCGGFLVALAHFRQSSVRVMAGQPVRTGQPLGTIGNSGASDHPHLHVHVQRPGSAAAPFSGRPLAARIAGHYLVRGDRP